MKTYIISVPDGSEKLINYLQMVNGEIKRLPRPKEHLKSSVYEWGDKRTNINSLIRMGKDNKYVDGWNDCLRMILETCKN